MSRTVTVYTAPGCTLCRAALEDLELLAAEQALDVRAVDVTADPVLLERYLLLVPVVEIAAGAVLQPPISLGQLRSALAAAGSSS